MLAEALDLYLHDFMHCADLIAVFMRRLGVPTVLKCSVNVQIKTSAEILLCLCKVTICAKVQKETNNADVQ